MRNQNRVVGDSLKERGGPGVHGKDGGLEAGLSAHVQILQVGECSDVARHNLVAHELLELRIGNL